LSQPLNPSSTSGAANLGVKQLDTGSSMYNRNQDSQVDLEIAHKEVIIGEGDPSQENNSMSNARLRPEDSGSNFGLQTEK